MPQRYGDSWLIPTFFLFFISTTCVGNRNLRQIPAFHAITVAKTQSGFAEDTHVGFADLYRDSAIQTSLMALAAPSVRKNSNKFGFLLTYSYLCTQNGVFKVVK
jgi:hypothetical protein